MQTYTFGEAGSGVFWLLVGIGFVIGLVVFIACPGR